MCFFGKIDMNKFCNNIQLKNNKIKYKIMHKGLK